MGWFRDNMGNGSCDTRMEGLTPSSRCNDTTKANQMEFQNFGRHRHISVRYHCLLAQASTASATFKTIGTHVPYFGEDCKTGTHWNLTCTTFGKTGLFEFMIAFGMSTFLSTCDML